MTQPEPALAHRQDRDIAVIGMIGRFPGARNLDEFWRNLIEGRESVQTFTDDELLASGIPRALFEHPDYVKAGTVLEDADLFDASFFGFSPREAEVIDPQQRIFLECAWEVLESAGYDPDRSRGRIGVFAGAGHNNYMQNVLSNRDVMSKVSNYQVLLGTDRSFFTTRACYKLDLTGPSFSVQAACSTSLVAVHLACQHLQNFECDMALAGGASITFPQHAGYLYQRGMILSPDGHCRPFDADANGTVAGKGVGVVLLKRLSEALDDGDTIHAVVKSSAVNNDGASKVGFTAPSVDGQAEVIAEALAKAEIAAESVGYIETHGTGTELGDPIELAALTEVFRASTNETGICALGALKSNLGHMDAAAGIGGLLKAILAVKHGLLPPSPHFRKPNPKLDLEHSPFYVNTELREWSTSPAPRRAGVSAFGIGGANAHVIVEEPPVAVSEAALRPSQLLLVSAKTAAALDRSSENLVEHFSHHPNLFLADATHTLAVGRRTFSHRRFVVAGSLAEAERALESRDPERMAASNGDEGAKHAVFLFPGQGAQYATMGAELYRVEPVFREEVDRCLELLKTRHGSGDGDEVEDYRAFLFPAVGQEAEASAALRETKRTQPVLFVVEYALARLLVSWGIAPRAMAGHSVGEYTAACLAGVFSLEDALTLVSARGRLMQSASRGAMLAVPLSEAETRERLPKELALAASNAPNLTVVSGPEPTIDLFESALVADGLACRRLETSHAFHSAMMDPILESFAATFEGVRLTAPTIPFVSNVTGSWVRDEEATDPAYWVRHLRETVRFADAVATLTSDPGAVLVEVGPGTTLTSLAQIQLGRSERHRAVATMSHPRKRAVELGAGDTRTLLEGLGRLWLLGVRIDWEAFYANETPARVPLPTYPFERQRFWVAPQTATPGAADVPLARKKGDISEWFYVPTFHQTAPAELLRELPASLGRWLIFSEAGTGAGADDASAGRLSDEIAREVRRRGGEVTLVRRGDVYATTSTEEFTLDPLSPDHYIALFRDLDEADALPRTIVHLCSRGGGLDFQQARALSFDSLLYLAKALDRHDPAARVDVAFVSDSLHQVTGGEPLRAEKAMALGVGLVMSQELPGVHFASFDVDGSALQAGFVADLASLVSGETVAYRSGRRWARDHEPLRLGPKLATGETRREQGVYLVTGGLGKVGLEAARQLAASGSARLVLVGRTPLPPRGEWDTWIRERPEEGVATKLQKVRELEALGAEVVLESADVCDETAMRGVLDRTIEHFGALHGVIHAAASLEGQSMLPLRELTREGCEKQFAPKVGGTRVLEKLLSDMSLDFVLVTSSLSTVLGGLGFGAYAAANCFLAAHAERIRRDTGAPWIAVDWDGWDFSVGAKVGAAEYAMTPVEGSETLRRVLSQTLLGRVVVSTGDLAARRKTWVGSSPTRDDEESASASALHPRPTLDGNYVAPRDETERGLARIWQDLLGIESVGIHDSFFDLGGHSLLATQVIARVRASFQVELPLRSMFEASTIAELAERVKTLVWADQGPDAAVSDEAGVRQEIEI